MRFLTIILLPWFAVSAMNIGAAQTGGMNIGASQEDVGGTAATLAGHGGTAKWSDALADSVNYTITGTVDLVFQASSDSFSTIAWSDTATSLSGSGTFKDTTGTLAPSTEYDLRFYATSGGTGYDTTVRRDTTLDFEDTTGNWLYAPQISLDSLTVVSGGTGGGSVVGFSVSYQTVDSVAFGDSVVSTIDSTSGDTAWVVSPAYHTAGTVNAVAYGGGYAGTITNGWTYNAPSITSVSRDTVYTVGGGTISIAGTGLDNGTVTINGVSETTSLAADTSIVIPFNNALAAGKYPIVVTCGGVSTDGTDSIVVVANPDTSYFGDLPASGSLVWMFNPNAYSGVSSSPSDSLPVVAGPAAPHRLVFDQQRLGSGKGYLTDSAGVWIPHDTGFVSTNIPMQIDSAIDFTVHMSFTFDTFVVGQEYQLLHSQKTENVSIDRVYIKVRDTGTGPAFLASYSGAGGFAVSGVATVVNITSKGFNLNDTNSITLSVSDGYPSVYFNGQEASAYASRVRCKSPTGSAIIGAGIGHDTFFDNKGAGRTFYNMLFYNRALNSGEVSTLDGLGTDLSGVVTANSDGSGNFESEFISVDIGDGDESSLHIGNGLWP